MKRRHVATLIDVCHSDVTLVSGNYNSAVNVSAPSDLVLRNVSSVNEQLCSGRSSLLGFFVLAQNKSQKSSEATCQIRSLYGTIKTVKQRTRCIILETVTTKYYRSTTNQNKHVLKSHDELS